MEGKVKLKKSKVIKIDSQKSWEHYISYASIQCYPVVVHFSAFWCVPSLVMNPFFQELASNYKDALFLTLDVDEVMEIASKLEIKAVPTFVLLNGGAPVDKIVGANPDEIRKRGVEERLPSELSGGMTKRVTLARSIIYDTTKNSIEPKVLLYDEPTAGLDPIASTVVEDLICSVHIKG